MDQLKSCFKSTPVPVAGLMLGLAGLGNLIQPYGDHFRYTSGALAFIIILLLIGRFITDNNGFFKELNNPVVASVSPCFSMGIIILASYLVSVSPEIARVIWYTGIILHGLFVLLFSGKYLLNFNIKKVFPSYFIVYVGIVVASVTAPVFNNLILGQVIFWIGFLGYMVFLPIVAYRVFKVKEIIKPALPTIAIFTAPAGLCLAGYMSAFPDKNILMVGWLIFLTLVMITAVIFYLPKMLAVGFCPSFSAFTFPFVITAIGLRMAGNYLVGQYGISLLKYPALIVEFLATALVLFVFILYATFIFKKTLAN
ncbi:MAG: TDT family transporter [Halarsenatibacteraceae bacterium]